MKLAATLAGATLALLLAQGTALAQGVPGPKLPDAKPGDIRISVTNAVKGPLEGVLKQAEQVIGKPIFVEWGSARGGLRDEIMKGQDFEVAILLPDVNEELIREGHAAPGAIEIARVPVAIGLRGDTTVDVSSAEALKKTLLAAKSVKYAPTGAALDTVKKVLGTLGISDQVKDSSKQREPVELAASEYEINLYPLSEILPNKNLKNLGPVIAELQVPVVIQAVVGRHARDEKAARALIKFLQGPAIDAGLKEAGMMKGKAG